MKQEINEKLKIIRDLQRRYYIAIGGSIGLYLHGFDLGRDLSYSDIDIVSSDEGILKCTLGTIGAPEKDNRESNDMHGSLNFKTKTTELKVDIRIEKGKQDFVLKEYCGFEYKVALLHDILRWKELYSYKGVSKHTQDLNLIYQQLIKKQYNN